MAERAPRPLRIAVVGGGPAGSLFTLYALHYAQRSGRQVQVDLFEPRDFSRPGQRGCNMCAGIIPAAVLRELSQLDLALPRHLILGEIDTYVLHRGSSCLRVRVADPGSRVAAVFRGNGPGPGSPPEPISFDGFLLAAAESRGARIVRERVEEVMVRPIRSVWTRGGVWLPDLLVLASGVNGGTLRVSGSPYRPPRTESMAQAEVFLGEEEVRQRLGGAIHVFLPLGLPIKFGTLVPKGPFVSICLLGRGMEPRAMERFLGLEEVRRLLPDATRQVCGCRPRIAVGPARPAFDDGFVAVGDAGLTRLYKNGVGTALLTARSAAETVVLRGTGEREFRRHYTPLLRSIQRDNRFGRILFSLAGVLMRSRRFSTRDMVLAPRGVEPPSAEETEGRIVWGLLTGSYPYREIFRMFLAAGAEWRWLADLAKSAFPRAVPRHG